MRGVRNAIVKLEEERLTSFLSLWIKQTSGLMGLCHIKPAVACAGLTANTDHCAELVIDRAVDGETGNGTDNEVCHSRHQVWSWAAPSCLWFACGSLQRREKTFWGSDVCMPAPISPFAHTHKLLHVKPAAEPGWAQVCDEGEKFCPLYTRDSHWLAKTTVATAHSPSQLRKVSFSRLRFHHQLRIE